MEVTLLAFALVGWGGLFLCARDADYYRQEATEAREAAAFWMRKWAELEAECREAEECVNDECLEGR
jgi:hypothetical protein